MGYTHYFEQEQPISDANWKKNSTDIKKIIAEIKKNYSEINLISDDTNGKILTKNYINLNDRYNSHETFYLPKNELGFHFCKTALKPYDLVVTAILLTVHHHSPNSYTISSDGEYSEWQKAMNFNANLLGHSYLLPPRLSSSDGIIHNGVEEAEQQAKILANITNCVPIDVFIKKNNRYNL